MSRELHTTGVERFFEKNDIIVSKTDPKGRITYANDVFLHIAGYTESECLGAPHSLIRHPDMPRCVFKLLWDTVQSGREIFAYVINRCKNGDHYWVYAHVTPSFDLSGGIRGYHSNRRVPDRAVLESFIIPLYKELCAEERSYQNRKQGLEASMAHMLGLLEKEGMGYDEFVMTLPRRLNEPQTAVPSVSPQPSVRTAA
ncbi:PAS domain-containing protein [Amorphus orientalis]|uniref:PAS domain S-box-containing protein n=1 Tax=Amorphus orientalis TaxID=649198 RepID=A0AAE4ARJ9_9HYPH|nr:PAS domain-containing protein [Amorphus orientalis]MDQ0313920.1 PAS domain S-box-containing protein [Amorphus orientalis]